MCLTLIPSWWPVLIAFVLSLLLTKGTILVAHRRGWLCYPKADRWHQHPTALYGGVAIFMAWSFGTVSITPRFFPGWNPDIWALVACTLLIFALGLKDDIRALNPQVKLAGQAFIVATFIAGVGLYHLTPAFMLSMPVIFIWMLGLTNAFNLLDNMDGLCAGAAAISGALLTLFALLTGLPLIAALAAILTASSLGFLVFNFHPRRSARIFMGDCGSMALGFALSGLVVVAAGRLPKATPSTFLFPLLLMAIPIFDTTLVTICRRREGRAISQGGRDHSSHRLVYAGFSEKCAVGLLWALGAAVGGGGILLLRVNGPAPALTVVLLAAVFLALLGRRLSHLHDEDRQSGRVTVVKAT